MIKPPSVMRPSVFGGSRFVAFAAIVGMALIGVTGCQTSESSQSNTTQDDALQNDAAQSDVAQSGADRRALFDQGLAYPDFIKDVNRREEMWKRNSSKGEVPPELLSRLNETRGGASDQIHLLAVAEYGCSDSANIVPYLARFADTVEHIDLRIIDSTVGREVMESHLTPDGRAATPTIVVLDSNYREMGCLIERPKELQDWALANKETLTSEEFMEKKFAWYDEDLGKQSMTEIVAVITNAGSGLVNCDSPVDS